MLLSICRLAALAVAATAFVHAQDRGAIEKAVLETNDRGSIVQYGNALQTREQALAQTREGFRGIHSIEYRWKRQQVTVISPTVALLVSEAKRT